MTSGMLIRSQEVKVEEIEKRWKWMLSQKILNFNEDSKTTLKTVTKIKDQKVVMVMMIFMEDLTGKETKKVLIRKINSSKKEQDKKIKNSTREDENFHSS